MRMIKRIGGVLVLLLLIVAVVLAVQNRPKEAPAKVVATNFAGYDLARAVMGDETEVAMLLKPGAEMHNFEPTPEDIKKIQQADLLISVGGESEEWVADLAINSGVAEGKILRLMDLVELVKEEGEDEYDEHIWTSPTNMMKLAEGVRDKLAEIYPAEAEKYQGNTEEYVSQLKGVDERIRTVVLNGDRKMLVFGDRFPFRYLVEEYGLEYLAAFPGCAEQTEASSATVANLVREIRDGQSPVVLKTELSDGKLAQAIADETGAKVMTLYAMHNVSREDFEAGVTYVEMMERNVEVLLVALGR